MTRCVTVWIGGSSAAIAEIRCERTSALALTARDASRRESRIHPSLRSKLSLARLNLMDEAYSVGDPFDMIMCRNVMIYFDKQTQAKVLNRLCARLRPGGYLFIGHSESITGIELPLVTVANPIFRKT